MDSKQGDDKPTWLSYVTPQGAEPVTWQKNIQRYRHTCAGRALAEPCGLLQDNPQESHPDSSPLVLVEVP